MLTAINTPLRALFDALLYPFRELSPWVTLIPISAITGIVLLLVFKRTSNQAALEAVKAKITAGLFEIRMFNDDLRLMFRAQNDILLRSLTYMRLTLVPMLWTLPPLVLLIAQLQFHYGYEGFDAGQTTQLHVVLKPDALTATKPELTVAAPAGVHVVEPGVWVPSLREMVWRVDVEARDTYELAIGLGSETITKSLDATNRIVRRSPFRVRGWIDELLYPGEPALPADSAFESIKLDYADATVDFFGFGVHWLIAFFVLSIVVAFALRKPLGVTI
jgi:uncharacterized membrane protein (DUF106 family)